ncbi:hypothetical protein, partial [Vibrio lentus]|uniref:hypothetical protein n=1 Tax=Vibrio lentus TaxID=136468 RepID=UPI00406302AD
MSISDTCKVIPLHSRYYLFSVNYKGEFNSQTQKTDFPSWHTGQCLIGKEITNIRPLAKVPMLNVTDSENPQLWATVHKCTLCALGNGERDKYGAFEVLTPEHLIHAP